MTWLHRPAEQALAILAGFLAFHLAWAVGNDRLVWAGFGRFAGVFLVATIGLQRREWTLKTTAKLMAAVLAVEGVILCVLFLRP